MTEPQLMFEDFTPGREFLSQEKTVSAEEIIEFAKEFDPQPMHLSEEAGKASILGGLSASGWHISSITMRLFYDSVLSKTAGEGAPGIDYNEWRKPLIAGDTVKLKTTIKGARALSSRPGIGLIKIEQQLTNQRDELVLKLENPVMVRMRNKPAEATA